MAWATCTLQQGRAEVLRGLYPYRNNIMGTASSGSVTTIVDIGAAADGTHLESAVYSNNDFVGAWVYVPAVTAPKTSRVTVYDRDSGTLTLSPALGATAGTNPYEIHWKLPPERINDWILQRATEASPTFSTIAESTAINLSKFTLAEGVLADALRALAKSEEGDARKLMEMEADHHELLWLERLALEGRTPSVNRLNVRREQTEAAQVLRRF